MILLYIAAHRDSDDRWSVKCEEGPDCSHS